MTRQFQIGSATVGGAAPLFLIAGPCVLEDEAVVRRIARRLSQIALDLDIPLIFKASFDKANRSSADSYRGPGLEAGLQMLCGIGREFDLPVLSDVHTPEQCGPAGQALDALQIPAFLCRQTDLITQAVATGKPVNIKKGQFAAPDEMQNAVDKAIAAGSDKILLTERGSSFGYNNLVVDFRSLPVMRSMGWPVVFDATHSVQRPAAMGSSSGGDREMVDPLLRAAVAVGCDGLFMEVHEDPAAALCDGPNMVSLDDLPALLAGAKRLDRERRAIEAEG